MCGIVGMSLRCAVPARSHRMNTVKKVFTSMLVRAQERGSASTGLVMVTCTPGEKRSKAWILRAPIPASEFVEMDEYKEILEKVDNNCLSLLGHTRAVSGSQAPATNNNNNHPHVHGDIIGVHNGRLMNDSAIWEKYKGKIKAKGNCDSEAIFALVDYYLNSKIVETTEEAIEKTLQESNANYALAIMNAATPNKMYLVKDQNTPLSLAWWGQPEITMFASQWEYIEKALDKHDNHHVNLSVVRCQMPVNQIITLDAKVRAENWSELFVGKHTLSSKSYGSEAGRG